MLQGAIGLTLKAQLDFHSKEQFDCQCICDIYFCTHRKTMFAAHLQKASLATLSSLSLTRAGSVTAARAFLSTTTRKQLADAKAYAKSQAKTPAGFAVIKERQKEYKVQGDNGRRYN